MNVATVEIFTSSGRESLEGKKRTEMRDNCGGDEIILRNDHKEKNNSLNLIREDD